MGEVPNRSMVAARLTPMSTAQVISAQQLPRPRGSAVDADAVNLDPFVEVSLYIPGEPFPQKRRTNVVS